MCRPGSGSRGNIVSLVAAVVVLAVLFGGGGGLPASAQDGSQQPPAVPGGMGGRLLHYLVVELEWDSVPEAASYQVGVWVSGSAEYTALPAGGVSVDMDGSGARAVVRGLPDENYYYFTVRARNAFGTSDWSDFVFLNTDQGWPETPDPTPAPEPTPEPEVVPPDPDPPEPEVVPPDPDPPAPEVVPPVVDEPEPEVVPPVVDEPEPEVVPPDPDPPEPEVVPPDPDPPEPEVVPPDPDPPEPEVVPPDPTPEPEVVPPDPDLSAPSVALVLSSVRSAPGAEIGVTMSFAGLELDSDAGTVDYVFRADVLGADVCEDRAGGYGLGVDRYMHKVDEDPEVRTGTVGADCPVGDYTLEAILGLRGRRADIGVGPRAVLCGVPGPADGERCQRHGRAGEFGVLGDCQLLSRRVGLH